MNVLIIAYNRPDITVKLFDVLKIVKPENVFLSFDGPDLFKPGDFKKCELVQEIFKHFTWACNVRHRINKENIGCNENVLQSIDWFFSYVDEGMIIEDDCIPDPTFFYYSQTLLQKYSAQNDIFMISGCNLISTNNFSYNYRFTKLVNIWGWSTWKRAWSKRISDLKIWDSVRNTDLLNCYGNEGTRQWHLINDQYKGIRHLKWGTLWRLTCLINKGVNIIPSINLVANVGFNRVDATNTRFEHPISKNRVYKMNFPLKHPDMHINRNLDEQALNWYYNNINQ